jgi:hypothetical protein
MIEAELNNKAPEFASLEDVLTSTVFGLLKYVEAQFWLPAVLQDLERRNGESFDRAWFEPITNLEMAFWKRWPKNLPGGRTEPDLITTMNLGSAQKKGVIVWEMKYHSGLGPRQLEREYQGLSEVEPGDVKLLIHLSKAGGEAYRDFRGQLDQLSNQIASSGIKVVHYTWEWLFEVIAGRSVPRNAIIDDLIRYLAHKGFDPFKGFSTQCEVVAEQPYKFSDETMQADWSWPAKPFVMTSEAYRYG